MEESRGPSAFTLCVFFGAVGGMVAFRIVRRAAICIAKISDNFRQAATKWVTHKLFVKLQREHSERSSDHRRLGSRKVYEG